MSRLLALISVLSLLAGQAVGVGHTHQGTGIAEPADHAARPHVHLGGHGAHGHAHQHGSGAHGHTHHKGAHHGDVPRSEPTPTHDSDVVYIASGDMLPPIDEGCTDSLVAGQVACGAILTADVFHFGVSSIEGRNHGPPWVGCPIYLRQLSLRC